MHKIQHTTQSFRNRDLLFTLHPFSMFHLPNISRSFSSFIAAKLAEKGSFRRYAAHNHNNNDDNRGWGSEMKAVDKCNIIDPSVVKTVGQSDGGTFNWIKSIFKVNTFTF
mgnify:CR=1 FL=1